MSGAPPSRRRSSAFSPPTMTTFSFYNYDGDELVFDPSDDVLIVQSNSASHLSLTELPDGSGVTIVGSSKSLTLLGVTLESLNEGNVVTDLTKIVNAYVGNSFSSDLTGGDYGDQLIGGPADRVIEGVSVSTGGDGSGIYTAAPTVSSDSRFVVFESNAVHQAGDPGPNGVHDIWMKNLDTGDVTRVSATAGGAPGNQTSQSAIVTGDGRSVVFESNATNLKSGDTNGVSDIFLKDLVTGAVTRVSTGTDGHQGIGGASTGASVTNDGRYVAFESLATNLVTGDTNAASDVFVKDTLLGTLTIVSSSSSGTKGNAGSSGFGSRDASISADGNFVVFTSWSSNLVTGDTDGNSDIFVKNLATGQLTCVSTDALDLQVGGDSMHASISANGRYVVFESSSTLLDDGQDGAGAIYLRDLSTGQLTRVKGAGTTDQAGISISGDGRYVAFVAAESLDGTDTNAHPDVYVKDMQTGNVRLVSQSHAGLAGNGQSLVPQLSLDGSTIVFSTEASNLVSGDVNQAASTMVVTNPLFTTTLAGGWGDDLYIVTSASDRIVEVVETGGGGFGDAVETAMSYVLPDNVEILRLKGTASINGTGNAGNNSLMGNSAGNILRGEAGYDRLDGGLGADTMIGGADSDFYTVDNARDVVTEAANQGTDLVTSSVSYTLGAEVENLTLADVVTALNATGNAANNTLKGNWKDNILDGKGGADTMEGGPGDDIYIVDNVGDSILDGTDDGIGGDWGTDVVRSSVSYTLTNYLENLTLTGSAAIDGAGNGLNNTITGNAASNSLSGGEGNDTLSGAAGADAMTGGAGDDTYIVDDAGDKTIELVGGGTDVVRSSLSLTLQASVENLTLTGVGAINATGNTLANVLTGNTAGNVLNGGTGADSMTGSAGNDTYVVDNAGDKTIEVAGGGIDLVQSSISLTLQAEVENLTLTGTSTINGTGNSLANVITGNLASNVLNGGAGADSMSGGAGNDTYVVDNLGDKTIEAAGGGTDLVQSSASFTLQAEVENLTLTGTSAISGTGNALANAIVGNVAGNVLNGGTGADSMTGGSGNDTYIVDNTGDKTVEVAGGGIDLVQSSISFALQSEIENLTLTGTASINGVGNALNNVLTGNAAANVLTGGAGNDTYVVDNASDKTVEATGAGIDLVKSSISFTLQASVENLTLTGSAAINGTGNSLDNAIVGNAGNNVLDGSTGADSMTGGAGNDTYVADNTGDKAIEQTSGGIDLVQSSASFTLQDSIENLTLIGSTAINGTGNALANAIVGNAANNVLNGDAGADAMTGGAGNDTYVVDNAGDKTLEAVGGGIDLVQTSIDFTLQASVENLTLTGSGEIDGAGNSLDNKLVGNGVSNVLDGKAGSDTLTGGAGADFFVFTSSLGSDFITDFTSGVDKLELSQASLTVGDGDYWVDGGARISGPDGFNASAELVIFTHDIVGSITATNAAAAIGHANSNYAAGDTRIFVVDNGDDSAVYLFKSADSNATVSASELTLLATLDNNHATAVTDYYLGA
ncbi:hypothetical protein AACH06_14690 [Ideonella sp. DXS29W]|uniref:Calcium-binding protein n=1 Tax=Ideonella lacteola TaxID=2984193 RepID=A0ABU9BQL1_9BURK